MEEKEREKNRNNQDDTLKFMPAIWMYERMFVISTELHISAAMIATLLHERVHGSMTTNATHVWRLQWERKWESINYDDTCKHVHNQTGIHTE